MNNIKRNERFFYLLTASPPKQRKAILKDANKSQIFSICEICHNLLAGNVPVNINRLRKYKTIIRQIADKKIPLYKKRKLLINQTGGFLPIILPAILSAVGGIVGRAIGNRI